MVEPSCHVRESCAPSHLIEDRMSSPCPVCETPSEKGASGELQQVRCPCCGPFVITGTARAMLGSRLDDNAKAFARISHAIRTRTSDSSWFRVDSANLDELVQAPLPDDPLFVSHVAHDWWQDLSRRTGCRAKLRVIYGGAVARMRSVLKSPNHTC